MRIERFKEWLAGELTAGGVHVERYEVDPGLTDLAVGEGDQRLELRIVRTAPTTHQDDPNEPEKIVEREPSTEITVTRR